MRGSTPVRNSYRKKSVGKSPRKNSKSKSTGEGELYVHFWGLPPTESNKQNDVNYVEIPNKRIYEIYPGEGHLFIVAQDHEEKKQVYGFGDNTFNQISSKLSQKCAVPTLVSFPSKIKVNKIFSGVDFTFILTENEDVYSWGLNLKGQLGVGDLLNRSEPELVKELSNDRVSSSKKYLKKSELFSGESIQDIACGALHVIALTTSNRLFSVGYGNTYALGHGDNVTINSFKEITFFSEHSSKKFKVEKIDAGISHSGVLIANKVFLWGRFGKLKSQLAKQPIVITSISKSIDFIMGDLLTVIMSAEGDVYTLGENIDGQLGVGNKTASSNQVPNKVQLPIKIDYITGGLNHVFATSFEKKVAFAWGSNRFKQINPTDPRQMYQRPVEMDWISNGQTFAVTCMGNWTFYVSKVRLATDSKEKNKLAEEQLIKTKKELELTKKEKDKTLIENKKLKDQVKELNQLLLESNNESDQTNHLSHKSGDTVDEINDSMLISNRAIQKTA